jgi:hypothetical protein
MFARLVVIFMVYILPPALNEAVFILCCTQGTEDF